MPQYTPLFSDASNVKRIVGALTTTSAVFDDSYDPNTVGFLYAAKGGYSANTLLPLSYWTSIEYFGDYAYTIYYDGTKEQTDGVQTDLKVTDTFNEKSWQVNPDNGIGGNLQIERINVGNGTDIYDAACYQIALALAKKNGENVAASLNEDHLNWLTNGYDGNDPNKGSNGYNRAITNLKEKLLYYGGNSESPNQGTPIPSQTPVGAAANDPQAYLFRMITQKWTSLDPFFSPSTKATKEYQTYVTASGFPTGNSNYVDGTVTWLDWKPITGENAWGLILGPVQAWLIARGPGVLKSGKTYDLATKVLVALQAMQSPYTGGIYYATQGSLGNTGSEPVNPFGISTENNASTYGALKALQAALAPHDKYQATITTLLTGILGYLQTYAWDASNKLFYQGGVETFNATGSFEAFVPTPEPKAADVNTWGVASIGAGQIDTWFGAGTSYTIWQNVKEFAGFYYEGTLLGIGYSDQDGNGPKGSKGIMSAEWTFGAINMVRSLMAYYGSKSLHYASLAADEASMVAGVLNTYSDNYATAPAFAETRAPNYSKYVPTSTATSNAWFIYASKRYFIPFGWFANALPSLCSTSWALMVQYEFNPFNPTGSY